MAVAAINAIPHAYLKIIAKAGGVDPETQMEVAGMAPPDMVSALKRGAIDGFVGGAPFIQSVVHDGTAVILANGVNPMEPADLAPIAANVLVAGRNSVSSTARSAPRWASPWRRWPSSCTRSPRKRWPRSRSASAGSTTRSLPPPIKRRKT